MINQLKAWHKTKLGLLAFGLVELGISYGFVSLAIDRGNFLWWLLALILFVGGVQNLFKLAFLTMGKRV